MGSQQFSSDFRGFVFFRHEPRRRLFGNYASNRYQWNIAVFDRLEKDTNSGLNRTFVFRDEQVAVANVYLQDFIKLGYAELLDPPHAGPSDGRAGVRPERDPGASCLGRVVRLREIDATYIGQAGLGHFGRLNVDHALAYVFGKDSPVIAGRSGTDRR